MIENIDDDLFSNDVIFVNEDSNYVIFFSNEIDILSVDLNKSNTDNVMAWCLGLINLKSINQLKKLIAK